MSDDEDRPSGDEDRPANSKTYPPFEERAENMRRLGKAIREIMAELTGDHPEVTVQFAEECEEDTGPLASETEPLAAKDNVLPFRPRSKP